MNAFNDIFIFASWVDVVFNKRSLEIPSLITFCMFKKLCISHETMELCAPVNASYSVIYQKKPDLLSVTRHICMENKIFNIKFDLKMMIVRDVSFCKRSKIQNNNLAEPTLGFFYLVFHFIMHCTYNTFIHTYIRVMIS